MTINDNKTTVESHTFRKHKSVLYTVYLIIKHLFVCSLYFFSYVGFLVGGLPLKTIARKTLQRCFCMPNFQYKHSVSTVVCSQEAVCYLLFYSPGRWWFVFMKDSNSNSIWSIRGPGFVIVIKMYILVMYIRLCCIIWRFFLVSCFTWDRYDT